MKIALSLVIACLVPAAFCQEPQGASTLSPKYKVGDKDEKGRVIIHVFEDQKGSRQWPVHLRTDFGIMMFRSNIGEAHFIIARNSDKSVSDVTSYSQFLDDLGKLPKHSTLTIYDRCLMPVFYDFYPVH